MCLSAATVSKCARQSNGMAVSAAAVVRGDQNWPSSQSSSSVFSAMTSSFFVFQARYLQGTTDMREVSAWSRPVVLCAGGLSL